jgi:hypothetical protein
MPAGNKKGVTGTGAKRTELQRETDRAEMMRMLRRGYTHSMVAERLGVARSMVSYDFQVVMKQIIADRTADTEAIIAAKLQEYAEVKREAWEAWERSKEDVTRRTREGSSRSDGKGESSEGKRVSETTEIRTGDPRYLETVLNCLKAERELLGLNPAKQLEMRGKVEAQVLDINRLLAEVAGLADAARMDPADEAIGKLPGSVQDGVPPGKDVAHTTNGNGHP